MPSLHEAHVREVEVQTERGRPPIARVTSIDVRQWAVDHRDSLREAVARHGAVLVRGLEPATTAHLGEAAKRLPRQTMAEVEAFAPRDRHDVHVYSSSKWPPNQAMCMHHEMSYALTFPTLLVFACTTTPDAGGATGLAEAANVLDALPTEVVGQFERHGWLLTRSFNDLVGTPWRDAFGTDDRSAVEQYCTANDIEFDWLPDNGLRTRQHRPAVLRHPRTGRRCWFNQIAFLNEHTMEPAVRDYLVAEFGPAGLPFNTFRGDGAPVDPEVVQLINDCYERHTVREPWQAGDLLVVDNVRMAHSREPYEGDRNVIVVLGDPQQRR